VGRLRRTATIRKQNVSGNDGGTNLIDPPVNGSAIGATDGVEVSDPDAATNDDHGTDGATGVDGAIDPRILASSGAGGNGGSDAGAGSGSGKRRGPKPGTKRGKKPDASEAKSALSELLNLTHSMLAALTHQPDLRLEASECDQLAGALTKVASYYNISAIIDGEMMAWGTLILIAGKIYGTRVTARMIRKQRPVGSASIPPAKITVTEAPSVQ
jgi:hypothetical protein